MRNEQKNNRRHHSPHLLFSSSSSNFPFFFFLSFSPGQMEPTDIECQESTGHSHSPAAPQTQPAIVLDETHHIHFSAPPAYEPPENDSPQFPSKPSVIPPKLGALRRSDKDAMDSFFILLCGTKAPLPSLLSLWFGALALTLTLGGAFLSLSLSSGYCHEQRECRVRLWSSERSGTSHAWLPRVRPGGERNPGIPAEPATLLQNFRQ